MQQGKSGFSMAALLQNLKPDEIEEQRSTLKRASSSEEDEEAVKFIKHRKSMNEFNEVGHNFQKYQENKPAKGVTLEISNMFMEYKEFEDKVHAKEELIEICERNSIHKFQFIGYFLNNSLSEKPNDFRNLIDMVFDYFLDEEKLIDSNQLIEG